MKNTAQKLKSDDIFSSDLEKIIHDLKNMHGTNGISQKQITSLLSDVYQYCDKKFVKQDQIEKIIKESMYNIEIKIAKLHSELFRWFIGTSLVQTSILFCGMIAILQCFAK